MVISVFDLFKVGIGPSSSHTVGPMWAANRFLLALDARRLIERVERVEVQLYGSLALTGKGHATDRAILLGLAGEVPDEVDPDAAGELVRAIRETGALRLMGRREIAFSETLDLQFRQLETMTKHPNGMRFLAHDGDGAVLLEEVYFSVGGGFVLSDAETERPRGEGRNATPPYPFATAEELLALGERHKMTIAEIVLANERAWREPAEIRAGVELAIEGKDILRDKDAWDGMAHFQLDMDAGRAPGGGDYQDGSDSVVLRIAPLLLSHHLQKPVQTYVTDAGQFSPGSTVFRQDLKAATEAAGVPDGMSEHAVGDQWTQDWMEIGWTSMPAPNGEQHTIDVFMRSVNVESGKKLRQAGREVYAAFHGQDTAGLTPSYDPNHDGSMDSLNSYGNTETIPPYEYNGESYPMGRVFRGSVASFHPDPLMQKMLDAQAVQPILNVDTSWLLVGHVDETISFVKMDNARGWGMAVNDAAMAKKMLEDLVSQGQGGVLMFEGQKWYTDTGTEPAQVTVQDVLNDTDVMGESAKAVVEVDGQMDVFKKEVGITDADVIPVPFLHWTAYGYSVAYQPGTVNGISLGDAHFGAPKTHGPIVNGKDPFAEQLETEFGKHGITIDWIEDWDLYHRLDGEVHCGSNTKRALPENAKWWESGR